MLNEVRFGYSRYRTSFNSLNANYDPSQAGIDFGTGKLGLPEIDFGGIFENLGATAFSIPRGRTSQTFQILDNFTWVRGHHTIKFGGEFRRALIDSFNDNLERGGIVFGPGNGLDPDPGTDILAAYYLGFDSFTLANAGDTHRSTSNNGFALFAQDDFRATQNLTINLGLRWEYFGPLNEAHNILANLGSDGNLAMVGTDGVDGAYKKDRNNFGPSSGLCLESVARYRDSGSLWCVLRLHPATLADDQLY
jgi:outer membrane receptor protein involved in Fe transport